MSGWWPSLSAMSATALTNAFSSFYFFKFKGPPHASPPPPAPPRCPAARRRSASSRPSGGTPPSHGTHRQDARSSIGEYVPPPKQCLPLEFHHVRPPAGRLVPARRPPQRLTNPLPLA